MPSRSVFPPVATAEWDAAIHHDLKGADYQKRLVWRLDEGISVEPYYRRDHPTQAPGTPPPGATPFLRGRGQAWEPVDPAELPTDAIRADAWHDAGAHAVQEIAYALSAGVDRLDAATQAQRSADDAAREIAFVFAVGSTYFVEIAKLRAARVTWAQVLRAYGLSDEASVPMRLLVRTARANKSASDTATNLLRCTTEAMAAAIGGADAVAVEATGFDAHLATNVTRILDEEAHLRAVADPAAGAYVVEALTDALAREAWTLFQQVEREGGYGAAVSSGRLSQAIATTRATRAAAIATRKRTLVGVNNYPDTAGAPAVPAALPGDEAAPFGGERLAAPFERIVARTARHAAAGGRIPHIHLLTRGHIAMRTARANFCLNFFGCAGFSITQGDALVDADLVVLCSADPEYLALAGEIVPACASPVIVAGAPGEQGDALRAAGVAGFVHLGIDAVRTLSDWQDRFGLPA